MGIEVTLLAIVEPANLLQHIQDRRIHSDDLTLIDAYLRQRQQRGRRFDAFTQGDARLIPLIDALEAMIATSPDLARRRCELDRRHAWLHWTLAAATAHSDHAQWAVYGRVPIAPHARSTQGFPLNWCDPATCRDLAHWLSAIAPISIERACDPAAMRQADLYKITQTDDEELCARILADFTALRNFYREVVAHQQAAIIIQD